MVNKYEVINFIQVLTSERNQCGVYIYLYTYTSCPDPALPMYLGFAELVLNI